MTHAFPTRRSSDRAAGLFKEHAECVGAKAECGSDARRQAIAARRTDHQHFLRAVSAHALGTGRGDLFAHVVLAAERMRGGADEAADLGMRSEEHTSELQSLMRISYAVFCLK